MVICKYLWSLSILPDIFEVFARHGSIIISDLIHTYETYFNPIETLIKIVRCDYWYYNIVFVRVECWRTVRLWLVVSDRCFKLFYHFLSGVRAPRNLLMEDCRRFWICLDSNRFIVLRFVLSWEAGVAARCVT